MRKIPFYPLLVLLLLGLGSYLGCEPGNFTPPLTPTSSTASSQVQLAATTVPPRTADTILMASFNIQRLGPSKMGNDWVMERLAEIVRLFDIVAIQEVTDVSGRVVPALVERINQQGSRYQFVLSPRVGRDATGYFEQYAYLYDTARIAGGPDYCYLVQDPSDLLHREPHVGRFAARAAANPFTFTLVNIHTDPSALDTNLTSPLCCWKFAIIIPRGCVIGDLNDRPGRLRGWSRFKAGGDSRAHDQVRTLDSFMLDRD